MKTPESCETLLPSFFIGSNGRSILHGVTRAAIEATLANGPKAAAKMGTAVDATHQSLRKD
jgi:hypothetical protein